MSEDLRVKDLLRRGEISVRRSVGHETVAFLRSRKWRRPVGCTARLFSGMGTEDPFEPPPDYVPPERAHRTVGAAARFARIDNYEKRKQRSKSPFPGGPGGSGGVPEWVEKLRQLREANRASKAEQPGRKHRKAPRAVHTPSGGREADDPLSPDERRPPRVQGPQREADTSRAGRFRARPQRASARNQPAQGADAEVDRTPPKVGQGASEPPPQRRRRPRVVADAQDGEVDRRPPKVEHIVTDSNGEPLRARRDRREQKAGAGTLGGQGERSEPPATLPPPQRPEPEQPPVQEPSAQEPPAKAAPGPVDRSPSGGNAGSLDDLFGGMDQGRVRIGRRESPPEEPDDEPPEDDAVDRRPPKVAHDPKTDGVDRRPPKVTHDPKTDGVDRRPPRLDHDPTADGVDRRPPRVTSDPTADGVDRRPPRVEREAAPRARRRPQVATNPTADGIDRRPPRVAERAEKPSPGTRRKVVHGGEPPGGRPPHPGTTGTSGEEPAPASASSSEPAPEPEIDRSPSRGAGGGGLDDLFATPNEGRAKLGPRTKRSEPAPDDDGDEGDAQADEEAIDRRPPRILDVDPSELPK